MSAQIGHETHWGRMMTKLRGIAGGRSLASGALAAVGAMMLLGAVVSPAGAVSSGSFGLSSNAFKNATPGYAPPGGIYAPFTECPLRNPLMAESVPGDATGCIAGLATSGTFSFGSTTVQVVHPVTAQFGVYSPPNASPNQFSGGVLQALNGKTLVDSPEYVPGGLAKALGCPSSTPPLKKLCDEARQPGNANVNAWVQEAGPISNFGLTSWTQPVKIRLINPVLGDNCYIGSNSSPVVLNPSITSGSLSFVPDPNPTLFPNIAVLEITGAQATDTTFSLPPVQGCGPGGAANIAVDSAIDASQGLPSPSGSNSLVLNGNFYFADSYGLPRQAHTLLLAFRASHP
jgi:hypothetical protein